VLCKHEVVGSIPSGSTRLRSRSRVKTARRRPKGEAWAVAASYAWQASASNTATRTAETISFEDMPVRASRICASSRIFDIVKAGLAGLHDRLILIRHSRLIA
jgi:hypothetical protein